MPVKKKIHKVPSQTRLREVAWEAGQNYPVPHTSDYISLFMITPWQGHVHWNVRERTVNALIKKKKISEGKYYPLIRIYDVTDIIFDGTNSHKYFDLMINRLEGHYTFGHDHGSRSYMAEIGFRSGDDFHAVSRSEAVFFDSERPTGKYSTAGFFGGGKLNMTFPVENIFDAPVYERMNDELSKITCKTPLSPAVVQIEFNDGTLSESRESSYVLNMTEGMKKFGCDPELLTRKIEAGSDKPDKTILKQVSEACASVLNDLEEKHGKKTFDLVHCHDWQTAQAGMDAKKKLKLPLVLSLHSTEFERVQTANLSQLSKKICSIEKKAVSAADLVIVPNGSVSQKVTEMYEADPEKLIIIPDAVGDNNDSNTRSSSEARQWFGIPQDSMVVLFSGEMSHAAGADLFMEALPVVCRNHRQSYFILAGEGPMKGELETRAHHMGVAHRCRFPGDLPRKTFEAVLMSADFVVIPARSWQGEGLARLAMDFGKPVLATHQAGVTCIEHGKNGLVTFDNPGSIVWGIQELLHNPLKDSMMMAAARKNAGQSPSPERIAAQHYMYYQIAVSRTGKAGNG